MLGVHFLGGSRIALDEVPMPEPHGRWVVVRVRSAAICGTDRDNLEGPGQVTIPGHESAGEVVAVDRPTRVRVGDRVAVNCHVTCGGCEHCLRGDLYFCPELTVIGFDYDGGFAECVLVPESSCMPLPEDISFEMGSLLVDMVGTAYRAVKRARVQPGDRVAVWGAGPIGLSAMLVARQFGARVASVDLSEGRLEIARSLGADLTLNPSRDDVQEVLHDWTEGRGLEVGLDCVGRQKAAEAALGAVKKRGTLVVVGVSHALTLNPWEHLICRELTVFGTRNFNAFEFNEMIALVRGGMPAEQIITHRFPVAQAKAAFALFRSGECGKVVLTG
jgi:L-iditol 2-dehydrogenase